MDETIKKRKSKWITSYSSITVQEAEKRLNIRFNNIISKSCKIENLLDLESINKNTYDIKDKIYERIVEYIEAEEYPSISEYTFKEANIFDLVGTILIPLISYFKHKEKKESIVLRREKEIIATDNKTGGNEEFVIVDVISVTKERFILIIESKRSNIGDAMKQCLLSVKDAYDNNNDKRIMYGFMTTGDSWQLVSYDGNIFKMSEDFKIIFPTMKNNKKRWIDDFSILIDALYFILLQN